MTYSVKKMTETLVSVTVFPVPGKCPFQSLVRLSGDFAQLTTEDFTHRRHR